jgi:hypothetical protein
MCWPLLATIFLVGIGAEWLWLPKPANAEAYHQRIRAAAAEMPLRVGNWIGAETPVPDAAVKMLSPNVIISRRYLNVVTAGEASLLLVQCGDARDIVVHYPPICLCNSGWTLADAKPRDWNVGGLLVRGTEYQFTMRSLDQMSSIVVDNFMVLPTGSIVRNMDAVNDAASDVQRRYFGAAQVQIITPAAMPAADRESVFSELVGSMAHTIDAIREGAGR